MSTQKGGVWLRLYPSAWRERYGEELQELVLATSGEGPIPWHTRIDLLRSGVRERLHAMGLAGGDTPPAEQARAGALLVLCAWALFVVGGGVTQKFSEQWQHGTPPPNRAHHLESLARCLPTSSRKRALRPLADTTTGDYG